MADPDAALEPPRRRLHRPRLVAVATTLAALAVVAAFLLGRSLGPGQHDAIAAGSAQIVASVPVEMRAVDPRPVFVGSVVAASTVDVVAPAGSYVTAQAVEVGAQIDAGASLGEVSGAPRIALSAPLAPYRPLELGSAGHDVRLLQESIARAGLPLAPTGTADRELFAAVDALLRRAGHQPVGATIPSDLFVPLQLPTTVAAAAPVGTVLGAETPLVALVESPQRIDIRVDPIGMQDIAVGGSMMIELPGSPPFEARVAVIGEFAAAEGGRPPGRDVTLVSDAPALAAAQPGTSVRVGPVDPVAREIAVPLTAVREDAAGSYVLVATEPAQRVPVSVVRTAAGWAAVEGELSIDDRVIVS